MSYNDKILERFDASVDDEFERDMLYRSMAISYHWLIYGVFAIGVVLAWVLPGLYSVFSALPVGVIGIAAGFGDSWLRHRVPVPRLNTPTSEYAVMVVLALTWVAGVIFRSFSVLGLADLPGYLLMLGFAVVGSGVTIYNYKKQRQRDRTRLDAELDED